jgi:hypothetical protein
MGKAMKRAKSGPSAKAQLAGFLSKYSPGIAAQAGKTLTKMKRLVPGAIQLVYDNYNALVIGFCPSERASEGIFSIVLYPRYVSLVFLQAGVRPIPDPKGLLQGSAKVVRHIRLESADDLDTPHVKALIRAALARAAIPIPRSARGKLIIRSIAAKQRPRRPRGER